MGVTNSSKEIDVSSIACDGIFKVTLSLAATPDIVENPTDIVLILDRSGSMAGSPLTSLKAGAKKFIDIIDEATDGAQDNNIGSGSHIGIVSFATTASQDTQLITSVDDLKDAVDGLSASGNTNHGEAFEKAVQLFDPASSNGRIMIMFTDGKTTAGPEPAPIAAAARAQGIVIYCIGLVGTTGIDESALNDWATDPDDSHVAITPNEDKLIELFEDLAANITKPGATNVLIEEELNSDFEIESILSPTKGSAAITGPTTLSWTIDELGVSSGEGASFEFYAKHVGITSGLKKVNEAITYQDDQNNVVVFGEPEIDVECDLVVFPEPCPTPVDVDIQGCEDIVEFFGGDVNLSGLGRILHLDVRIKNVCPHKAVALAVILTEVDKNGDEHSRGMKTLVVPAHSYSVCRDVLVRCVEFVLPEELDVSGGDPKSICNERNFKARFIAHYIDNDYQCCEEII